MELSMQLSGVREAIRDFNGWQGHAVIMFDTLTGDVWTDVFADDESFNPCKKTTVAVYIKDALHGRNKRVTKDRLNDLLNKAAAHDWAKMDDMTAYNIYQDIINSIYDR